MLVWPSVLVALIGVVLLVVGSILGWEVFPKIIDDQIKDNVKLSEGSEQYGRWENVPMPLHFKVYMFAVKNPEEVVEGGKPILEERGPYIYKQHRSKRNITKEDDHLTYFQDKIFEFDAEASAPLTEEDEITMINVAYHALIQLVEETIPGMLEYFDRDSADIFNNQGVFLKTTVGQFLFSGVTLCPGGKPSGMCTIIKSFPSDNIRPANDKRSLLFSLLHYKNYTHDGLYKINTGEVTANSLGSIEEWEGSEYLKFWNNNSDETVSKCNMIEGTDSSIYPPLLKGRTQLSIYSSDVCRSVMTHYSGTDTYKGIEGMVFKTTEDFLPPANLTDDTHCYCLGKTKGILQETNHCLRKGAMELHSCLKSHTVLTQPHFMDADELYQKGVTGLKPNATLHETFVLVEQNTGTVLRGAKRVQFNLFMRKIKDMKATDKLTTTLMPFMWCDEGIDLNDDLIDMLKGELDTLSKATTIVEAIKWTMVAVGIVMTIVGVIWFIAARRKRDHALTTI